MAFTGNQQNFMYNSLVSKKLLRDYPVLDSQFPCVTEKLQANLSFLQEEVPDQWKVQKCGDNVLYIAAAIGNREDFQSIFNGMGANIKCLHRLAEHHCLLQCALQPASILKTSQCFIRLYAWKIRIRAVWPMNGTASKTGIRFLEFLKLGQSSRIRSAVRINPLQLFASFLYFSS